MTKRGDTPSKRKKTARQKVLSKYPAAQWYKSKDTGRWIIVTGFPNHTRLGAAETLHEAWRRAARNLII